VETGCVTACITKHLILCSNWKWEKIHLGTEQRDKFSVKLSLDFSVQTKELSSPDVEGQTEQVLKNLGAVLEAGGSGFEHVLKTTVLLVDIGDFAAVNAVYGKTLVVGRLVLGSWTPSPRMCTERSLSGLQQDTLRPSRPRERALLSSRFPLEHSWRSKQWLPCPRSPQSGDQTPKIQGQDARSYDRGSARRANSLFPT
jgi:Endoribonuclease L-PSP